jgi:purine-nucleoside phosphorylase
VIPDEALPVDGTSLALGADGPLAPDAALLESLLAAAGGHAHCARIVSSDLFYDSPAGQEQEWLDAGALAVEMETAALFALARRRGLQAASLLLVSDLVLPRRVRIEPEPLRLGELRLGAVAVAALREESAPGGG